MNPILATPPGPVTLVFPADPIAGPQAVIFRIWLDDVMRSAQRIVVDLSRVQFMDSSGCAVLLRAHKELEAQGGHLAVCDVTSPIRALFDLLRLPRVLHVFSTRVEAAQFLSEGAASPAVILLPAGG
jgi:anti-anti-sigma factor